MRCCAGPVNPAFFAVNPTAEYDSFLTIGVDGPALTPGAMSSVGIDFSTWDESTGIDSDNAAVFFMDPDHGATTEPVVFAQLTVRSGTQFTGQIAAQGRSVQHGGPRPADWAWEFSRLPGKDAFNLLKGQRALSHINTRGSTGKH